jgi:hypothetical protein
VHAIAVNGASQGLLGQRALLDGDIFLLHVEHARGRFAVGIALEFRPL